MARCPECGQKDCCGASMSEEIDRLTAQLAEREAEIAQLKHYCEKCMYIKEYQKENTTLRAEVERLKESFATNVSLIECKKCRR